MPFPVTELRDIKFTPQDSRPDICTQAKQDNKAFSTPILNFAPNFSANERAGRGCYWMHDIAKICSRTSRVYS